MVLAQESFDPSSTQASAGYQMLTDLPGLGETVRTRNFAGLINSLYKIGIGLGTMLAVIMIIYAGFEYSVTSVANKKSDMKRRIGLALGGLALLAGSYVLLLLINPQLVQYSELDLVNVNYENVEVNEEINLNAQAVDTTLPRAKDTSEYIWVADDYEEGDATYYTQAQCTQATSGPCNSRDNPNYVGPTGTPTLSGSGVILQLDQSDPAFELLLTPENIRSNEGLQGWPVNLYRRPSDFIDCKGNAGGTGKAQIAAMVIEADAYINREMYNAGYLELEAGRIQTPTINSAARSHKATGGTCVTSGTGANHPYFHSIDYGLHMLSNEGRVFFTELALQTGACRMGFGESYAHVQWNGAGGAECSGTPGDHAGYSYIFWCYGAGRPFFDGRVREGWSGSCGGR